MSFGLLMRDNTPVDFPFRRSGASPEASVNLGFVPGGPYYPQRMGFVPGGPYYPRRYGHQQLPAGPRLSFVPGGPYFPANRVFRGYGIPPRQAARVPQYGYVDESGYDHGEDPVPGTTVDKESTGWAQTATGLINAVTGVVGAVASTINPQSGAAGSSCPSGYYLAGGRCYPPQQSGGGGNMSMLALGALGLGAAFLLLRKK